MKQTETIPWMGSNKPYHVGQAISKWRRKGAFDFTEIVNKHGLKQRIVGQIVRFISHFSSKLPIQF